MEHRYLKTRVGKIHAFLVTPTIPILMVAFYIDYVKGKEPNLWGIGISIIGFALFLKGKVSVLEQKKFFTFGCDLMNQKNTNLYFLGWVLMLAGYLLSWS